MFASNRTAALADLLTAVDRLAPVARAHADESERLRTLAPAVVDALRGSGLAQLAVPESLGGGEADPSTQLAVFEAMAHADTSAGWCLMIAAMTNALAGAYLADPGAAEVFRAPPLCAGLQTPSGTARHVDGGYILDGRWGFGSGIRHASWIVTSAIVVGDDGAPPAGPPPLRSVVVPVSEATIEDTWDVVGLRGSGSDHYRLDGVFVPEARTWVFPDGAPRRGGAMYRLPMIALLTAAHVGFALGAARRALDELAVVARLRTKAWTRVRLGDHAGFQLELGRTEARLSAARAWAVEVCAMLTASAGELGERDWIAVRGATTYVTEIAAEVATFAYRASGGGAVYASSPVQRPFRDLLAAVQHIAATDDAYEFIGRCRLGLSTPHPLLQPRRPA